MGAVAGLRLGGGVPPRIVVDHGVGGGEVEADATGLQREQEQRHLAVLEALHRLGAVARLAGEGDVANAPAIEFGGDQFQHAGELREQQHLAPLVEQRRQHVHQQLELGRLVHVARRFELDQPRIAADLAQLEQRVQHHDAGVGDAALGDHLAQLLGQRQAQPFVEVALAAFQHHAAGDLGFRRQLPGHLRLGSAQDERRQPQVEPLLAFLVVLLLDRHPVVAAKRTLVAEQARHREVDLRPQFAQMVFQRRAGEADVARGAQTEQRAARLGARVFHLLRLVQHDQRERLPAQGDHIARQQRVAGQHDVLRAELGKLLRALRPVQGQHAQRRREAGDLRLPVRNQAGRHHDQRRLAQRAALFQRQQVGDQLQRLAQPHVVGEYAADAGLGQCVEPAQAFALVRPQLHREPVGHRVAGALGGIAQARGKAEQRLGRLQRAAAGHRRHQLLQTAGLHPRQMQLLARFLQVFGQRRQQAAQLLQPHRHAAPRVHRRIPHGILRLVRRRPQVELMLGQRLRHRGQQVVPLAVQLDADLQVECLVVGVLHRMAVPAHRTFQHLERKARRVLDLEVFLFQPGPQGEPARRRVDLQRTGVTGAGK